MRELFVRDAHNLCYRRVLQVGFSDLSSVSTFYTEQRDCNCRVASVCYHDQARLIIDDGVGVQVRPRTFAHHAQ